MKPSFRKPHEGLWKIIQFNYKSYVLSLCLIPIVIVLLFTIQFPLILTFGLIFFLLLLIWWSIASLFVSHLIYDKSLLYQFVWLDTFLPKKPSSALIVHAGFDEVSLLLKDWSPHTLWRALDFFDGKILTEASLTRARHFYPSPNSELCSYDHWPIENNSVETIFFIFSAHELRKSSQRQTLFREAARSLQLKGQIILIEHLRDLPNFIAFGPGFFHFHSYQTWRFDWESAGLKFEKETRITPWVRVWCFTVA